MNISWYVLIAIPRTGALNNQKSNRQIPICLTIDYTPFHFSLPHLRTVILFFRMEKATQTGGFFLRVSKKPPIV